MRTLNRKGIAQTVSVVMVILISLVLSGALAFMLTHNIVATLSPQTVCAELMLDSPLSIERTFYNPQTQDLEVTIKRALDSPDITNMEFQLLAGGTIRSFSCTSSCGDCEMLEAGSTKIYYLKENAQVEDVALKVNGCTLTHKLINEP